MHTHYRVRVKRGDAEIEVESSDREYVDAKLQELLSEPGITLPTRPAPKHIPINSGDHGAKTVSLPEFVKQLGAKSGPEKILAIAYFLEKFDGRENLRPSDINDGLRVIRQAYQNPYDTIRKLKQRALLIDAKEPGCFVISATGEADIEKRLSTNES